MWKLLDCDYFVLFFKLMIYVCRYTMAHVEWEFLLLQYAWRHDYSNLYNYITHNWPAMYDYNCGYNLLLHMLTYRHTKFHLNWWGLGLRFPLLVQ